MSKNAHNAIARRERGAGRPSPAESIELRVKALRLLLEGQEVSPPILARALGCNLKTARHIVNDIADLRSTLIRTPRGCLTLGSANSSYHIRQLSKNLRKKRGIAAKVGQLIRGVRSVVCGPGSTVKICADVILEQCAAPVIITNNLGIIDTVATPGVATIELVGGTYDPNIHACIGGSLDVLLERVNCEAGIIGVSGISADGCLCVAHATEVPVLQQLVRRATKRLFVVFDSTKVGAADTFTFRTIKELLGDENLPNREIHLVTTRPDQDKGKAAILQGLAQLERVEVVYADDD